LFRNTGSPATRRSGPHLLDRATLLSTFDIRMIDLGNFRPGVPADDVVEATEYNGPAELEP